MEKQKTYLITGASGFIGSSLADKLLSEGYNVINIDEMNDYYNVNIKKNNIKSHLNDSHYHFYQIDIRDIDSLIKVFTSHHIDAIIHLAARAGVRPSLEQPLLYESVNVKGTLNLLECAKNFNIKNFVFASSSSVYGNAKIVPFSELENVDNPISPYAATKKSGELLCYTYHHLYKLNIMCLRFFTVYGPRQRPDLAINKFARLIEEGKPITLFGDGSTSRDYTYIDDIVFGIQKAITYTESHNDCYEIVNLGSDSPITLIGMVHVIEKALNKKAIIEYKEMQPGDVIRTYASIEKAKKLLNYSPSLSFEEGIKKFIEWRKENEN